MIKMKFNEKEFERLINKMMDKKKKLSGRDFVKLVFLSGWDTGERQTNKKEIKFLKELSKMKVIRNDSSLRKIEQRIRKLEDKTEP